MRCRSGTFGQLPSKVCCSSDRITICWLGNTSHSGVDTLGGPVRSGYQDWVGPQLARLEGLLQQVPRDMFRPFRVVVEAIQELALALRLSAKMQHRENQWREEHAPAEARVEELERSRAKWEAEIEALLMKADSTLRSANNAEARARTMAKHEESRSDPFPEDGDPVEEDNLPGYAPVSPEERVLDVRMDLAANDAALRAKW